MALHMEGNRMTQHAVCASCNRPVYRRSLTNGDWGAWLHTTSIHSFLNGSHQAEPKFDDE